MEQIYILDGLKAQIQRDSVLRMIDCDKNSPVYEEMIEEFGEIYPEILPLAEPVGILGFGELSENTATSEYPAGTKVIYAVLSVGDKIKSLSTNAFSGGDYVKGMILDAMADSALFSLEDGLQKKLKEVCKVHNVGILRRLEAPHDIPMEVQKEAWKHLGLKDRLGIDISSGYMFDPVKTSCQVFVLTEDTDKFKAEHNCRKCSNVNCKFRNIPKVCVKVKRRNEVRTLILEEKESLMDVLIRSGYYISAVCGGKGICGKCKVRVIEGEAPVSPEDEKFFSKKEINNGWRLACMLYPEEDLGIAFELNDESDFEVLSDYESSAYNQSEPNDDGYKIAIDIGTTTIAFQMINSSKILHTVTGINRQRQYGADVVSRIQASVGGKNEELQNSIRVDLKNGILSLCKSCGIEPDRITRIAIACNTTMSHLLMGYDCKSLGQYPFTPINIDFIKGSIYDIIGLESCAEVTILPGISTYVGGDIVSGLYECGFDKSDAISLLVDLGTNGEMALGNRNRILVTSTAAGPAFEGGNISCGTGSVEGAVCSVKLNGANAKIQTIRNKPPIGICGTGVVELAAELIKAELIDETGLLDEDYFDSGFPVTKGADGENIVFTQKDVRELQLAKAAIRAGCETLLLRYGITKDRISKVYIAGGFGYRLDTKKAIDIGMLPDEFSDLTLAVGNSSLAGAVKYLQDDKGDDTLKKLVNVSEELSLSMDKDFSNFYMEAMMF